MENLVNQIIAKVREMYKYTAEYKELMNEDAKVILDEHNGTYTVREIVFGKHTTLSINNKRVFYQPEHGFSKVLIEYNSMNELLNM